MSEWWENFCIQENKARIQEMQEEIARLEKELEGAEMPEHIVIGFYVSPPTDCAGNPIEVIRYA